MFPVNHRRHGGGCLRFAIGPLAWAGVRDPAAHADAKCSGALSESLTDDGLAAEGPHLTMASVH